MIALLWASPNADGLTAAAKDCVLSGIQQAGCAAEVVHLNPCRIERCKACGNGWGTCRSDGKCVIADDFAAIYDTLLAASGIVLVTPVYWHDMAECMKALLDRLRRVETAHNHALTGKSCLLVACAGGSGLGAVECLHALEETIRHMGMKAADRLPVIRFNREYLLPALSGAGRTFAESVQADGAGAPE